MKKPEEMGILELKKYEEEVKKKAEELKAERLDKKEREERIREYEERLAECKRQRLEREEEEARRKAERDRKWAAYLERILQEQEEERARKRAEEARQERARKEQTRRRRARNLKFAAYGCAVLALLTLAAYGYSPELQQMYAEYQERQREQELQAELKARKEKEELEQITLEKNAAEAQKRRSADEIAAKNRREAQERQKGPELLAQITRDFKTGEQPFPDRNQANHSQYDVLRSAENAKHARYAVESQEGLVSFHKSELNDVVNRYQGWMHGQPTSFFQNQLADSLRDLRALKLKAKQSELDLEAAKGRVWFWDNVEKIYGSIVQKKYDPKTLDSQEKYFAIFVCEKYHDRFIESKVLCKLTGEIVAQEPYFCVMKESLSGAADDPANREALKQPRVVFEHERGRHEWLGARFYRIPKSNAISACGNTEDEQ